MLVLSACLLHVGVELTAASAEMIGLLGWRLLLILRKMDLWGLVGRILRLSGVRVILGKLQLRPIARLVRILLLLAYC